MKDPYFKIVEEKIANKSLIEREEGWFEIAE